MTKLYDEEKRSSFSGRVKKGSYNSWLYCNPEGVGDLYSVISACYGALWCYSEIRKNLYIFFSKEVVEESYKSKEWCHWIINDSPVSSAFLTKDTSEGFELGFQMNMESDPRFLKVAMSILRHMFEYKWDWGYFRDLGYDEMDSYVLCTYFNILEDFLVPSKHRELHIICETGNVYKCFQGKLRKPSSMKAKDTPFCNCDGAQDFWGVDSHNSKSSYAGYTKMGYVKVKDEAFGGYDNIKAPKLCKENIDIFFKSVKKPGFSGEEEKELTICVD